MSGGYPLVTDTRAVHVESRQYNIGSFDLGQGILRVALKVGAFFYVPWFALMLFIGLPLIGPSMMLWIIPPTLTLTRAIQPDEGERLRLAAWADWLTWLLRAHTPIVNGDTADPRPAEPIATPIAFRPIPLTRPGGHLAQATA